MVFGTTRRYNNGCLGNRNVTLDNTAGMAIHEKRLAEEVEGWSEAKRSGCRNDSGMGFSPER
jgi:hypothetical protein